MKKLLIFGTSASEDMHYVDLSRYETVLHYMLSIGMRKKIKISEEVKNRMNRLRTEGSRSSL